MELTEFGGGVRVNYDKEGNGIASVIVGDFPLNKFEEWVKDCNLNFRGCRWAKTFSDHEKAKILDRMMKGDLNGK